MYEQFFEWAKNNGWQIEKAENKNTLNISVSERYKNIPDDYLQFINEFGSCINEEETTWFLTTSNYEEKSQDEWRYNEFELISLDSADDEDTIKEIKSFWDKHFPIVLSVGNGYEYYSISVENGNVIMGYEPEFEDSASIVAESFADFIKQIITGDIVL